MLAVLGLILATAFAAVALYVLLVEHPARRELNPAGQLTEWKPAYARGTVMQAGSAALGGIVGIAGFMQSRDGWQLAGGTALLAAIGYTFAFMWALNTRLKATAPDAASAQTATLLERWARLHRGRTALGLVALVCFAVAAYRAVSA